MIITRNKNIDYIKQLAIFTMVIDHLRYIMPEYQIEFIAIGRCAFIMFACVMAFNMKVLFDLEKYESIKIYFKNLIIFSIISEIPYQLASNGQNLGTLNIMVTLLLGFLGIACLNMKLKNTLKYSLLASLIGFCILIDSKIQFGCLGVLLILAFYLLFSLESQKQKYLMIPVVILLACLCNLQYYYDVLISSGITNIWVYTMLIGCLTGVALSLLLSFSVIDLSKLKIKKVGKWAWWFYPVHLALISAIGYVWVW